MFHSTFELSEDWQAVYEDLVEFHGELYAPNLSRTKFQVLVVEHLMKTNSAGAGLGFVAIKL